MVENMLCIFHFSVISIYCYLEVRQMITTRVFQSGSSHAVRIPTDIPTEIGEEFVVRRVGKVLVLLPPDDRWYALRETIGTFPEDFMKDREQPSWNQVPEKELL